MQKRTYDGIKREIVGLTGGHNAKVPLSRMVFARPKEDVDLMRAHTEYVAEDRACRRAELLLKSRKQRRGAGASGGIDVLVACLPTLGASVGGWVPGQLLKSRV